MKETLYKAENHTNRFNVEAFPAHSSEFSCVSGGCPCKTWKAVTTFSIYFEQKNVYQLF